MDRSGRRVKPTVTMSIVAALVVVAASACACEQPLKPVGQMVIVTSTSAATLPTETRQPGTSAPTNTRPSQNTQPNLAPVVKPVITSYSADPAEGTGCQGEPLITTLSWTTTGATEVTLDGAPVALQGSMQASVPCGNTQTFTLVATNSIGSDTKPVTVHSSD